MFTAAGRRAAEKVTEMVREWVAIIHEGIGPQDIGTATSVIDRYYENAVRRLGPEG